MAMSAEVETFQTAIFGLVDRLLACLDGLDEAGLNWRPPAAETNSLYTLAAHVVGSTENYLLEGLCGQSVARDREAEFGTAGDSADFIRQRWAAARQRIETALAALPPEELERVRQHPRRGPITGRYVLVMMTRHVAEHVGHAELTRQLLLAASAD